MTPRALALMVVLVIILPFLAARPHASAEGPLTRDAAYELASAYAWPVDTAVAIANCESSLIPTARNGQYRGLYQLGHEYDGLLRGDVFDPWENTRVAFEVYLRWGSTFGAWRACL